MRKTARITILGTGVGSLLTAASAAMALSVPTQDDAYHLGDGRDTGHVTSSSQLDVNAAVQAVLSRLPGAQVTEVEREIEHGRQLWEIDLVHRGIDYEALVVPSGRLVSLHIDRDGDDRAARSPGAATTGSTGTGLRDEDGRDGDDDFVEDRDEADRDVTTHHDSDEDGDRDGDRDRDGEQDADHDDRGLDDLDVDD